MPTLLLETKIKSTAEICFDLSTSIDLHKLSTAQTNEEAISGVTSGLIGLNETVTWRAKHFCIYQTLTTKITAHHRPSHFRDEQIKGIFKKLKHDHYFEEKENCVIMTDVFEFEAPFGIIGKMVSRLILKNYLRKFLMLRNNLIKEFAENGKWRKIVNRVPTT